MNKQLDDRRPAMALPHPGEHFWRAFAAKVRGSILGELAEDLLRERHPDDHIAPLLLRAASAPAKTTVPGWAAELARKAVSQAIEDVVSMSAARHVMDAGALRIDLGRFASIVVPGRSSTIADAGQWVAEGAPIPVRQFQLPGSTLTAHKLAVIATFTREMSDSSNIEDVIKALITEAAGPALDAAIFSTAAGTAARSPGILHGLTGLTPSTGGAYDDCGADLGALIGDLASRNGGANAVFVANPAQAMTIRFFSGTQLDAWGSVPLAGGTVLALEPASLAIMLGVETFDVADVGTLHMEDTTPGDISGGSTPVKSLFQTDTLALRMILRGDWAMRAPHVAYMTGVSW
jgi:hypothetical protein